MKGYSIVLSLYPSPVYFGGKEYYFVRQSVLMVFGCITRMKLDLKSDIYFAHCNNKGFQWKGGGEKGNFIEAVCPRCGWIYNCQLTEKYLKVEEQRRMTKAVKSHEC